MVSVSSSAISRTGSGGAPAASGKARTTWQSASSGRIAFKVARSIPSLAPATSVKAISA
jgi:hypothetical protein